MRAFRKISPRQSPSGLEIKLLAWAPRALLLSILLPALLAFLGRLVWSNQADGAKTIATIDIFSIALAITAVTAVLTIAIGSFIVYVMKGPGYVADAYPLDDASVPDISNPKSDEPDKGKNQSAKH